MDFSLTPAQAEMQNRARQAAQEVKAQAARLNREGRFPQEILERWAQEGFFGISLPRAYGGGGGDYVSYALAQMELAQACPSSALMLHVNHSIVGMGLAQFGTGAQKSRYLPPAAQGEVLTSFALTEPRAGSDPARLQTAASRENDGWVLAGEKNFVTSGPMADFALVAARSDPTGPPHKSISLFLVDLKNTPGIKMGPVEEKMGLVGASSVSLHFDNAPLPPDAVLGEVNNGLKLALGIMDHARVGAAAMAVGIGRAALQEALSYAKSREQFGQPLAQLQSIQFKLADLATDLEAAALLTLKAAWLKDQGQPFGTAAAMAKKFATDAAMAAAQEGLQILGGYGYLKDYPLERFFRDAKAGQIYEGTNEIMRLIIARDLLRGV
ncbi:MAG: acyl-CoA dehydrogenase family protein [Syntrophales bacterium]|nr:acyl-CoA dehydrogenase family protein [Syntrophales bacterium]MDD5641264.1 acyl-CoA dehydrogenase family protein [Syntrophales bacterium]